MKKNRRVIYFAIMLLIPIIFSEISLQVYYRLTNGSFLFERMVLPIYDSDDYRYYKLKPNLSYRHQTNEYDVTYYTNDQGLRTNHIRKNITSNKNEKIFRILFLGPSFTFGWANNYEDTFPSIIEKNITIRGKDVEVMNLGTPAQPIEYQLCWLKKIGYKFNPDLIIQSVYGNPARISTTCQEPKNPPIVQDGYLYLSEPNLVENLINIAKSSAIVFYGWYFYQYISSNFGNNVGLGTELYENVPEKSPAADYKIKYNTYNDYITFVRNIVKKEIPIIFLHIPYSYVVRPSDLSRWKNKAWKNPYMLRRESKEVEKALGQQNITFINPIDDLISKDKDTRMYYFLDIHFTPSGNRILAEKVIPVINDLISLKLNEVQN